MPVVVMRGKDKRSTADLSTAGEAKSRFALCIFDRRCYQSSSLAVDGVQGRGNPFTSYCRDVPEAVSGAQRDVSDEIAEHSDRPVVGR